MKNRRAPPLLGLILKNMPIDKRRARDNGAWGYCVCMWMERRRRKKTGRLAIIIKLQSDDEQQQQKLSPR